MKDLVANVDHLVFDVEIALEQQLGAQLLPFDGMDSGLFLLFLEIRFECRDGDKNCMI